MSLFIIARITVNLYVGACFSSEMHDHVHACILTMRLVLDSSTSELPWVSTPGNKTQ